MNEPRAFFVTKWVAVAYFTRQFTNTCFKPEMLSTGHQLMTGSKTKGLISFGVLVWSPYYFVNLGHNV